MITSEAQVAAYNLEEPSETLVAAYPADGTVLVDYPFVRLPVRTDSGDGEGEDATADGVASATETRARLLTAFAEAARGATERLAAAGFRTADGTGVLDVAGLAADAPATVATELDSAAQLEILRAWAVLTLRSRMLAVIDVSGSMEEPAESGLRRIDIFQQAAIGAM